VFVKKSRYKDAKFFQPSDMFPGIRAREIGTALGVVEHEVQAGDRLDQLARHYYSNDRMWWRIVDANPDIVFGPDMLGEDMAGQVILIPKAKE